METGFSRAHLSSREKAGAGCLAAPGGPGSWGGVVGCPGPGPWELCRLPPPCQGATWAHLLARRLSLRPQDLPMAHCPTPSIWPAHSVQPAGSLLPGDRLLHPRAPHRQAASACHHQEPPQVLLDGQRHERRHDARALLLAGQWGWGRQWQGQQPQEVQVHPPPSEPAPELLAEQLQDLLAGQAGAAQQDVSSAWPCI